MELNAALAADLSILNEALDDANVDLVQTLQQLAPAAKRAVDSYLGLSITATTRGRQINLTALDDHGVAAGIRTSLRVPLGAAVSPPAGADRDGAITGPGIELVLYAGNPGAFMDLAADLSWLTGRELSDFVLDAHLVVADHSDELVRASWVNQGIGVLIGRGYTPEHAAQEIDLLAKRTEQDRRRSAEHLLAGLRAPGPLTT